jgi:hypothetical protein
VQTAIGPGWQIWMHVDAMRRNPDGHPRKTLVSGDWNAGLIQHFRTHPGLNNNDRIDIAPVLAYNTAVTCVGFGEQK